MALMGEPGQTKAYQDDLRWRIVWQRFVNRCSIRDIFRSLCVSVSTIWRILDRYKCTGNVHRNPKVTPKARSLHEHDELILIQLVCQDPSIYLDEIKLEIQKVTGTIVSISTICRSLKKFGFTRKKLQNIAIQRCDLFKPNIWLKYLCTCIIVIC